MNPAPHRRAIMGGLATMALRPVSAGASSSDPILPAIETMRAATIALSDALGGLDEDDDAQMQRADAAADQANEVRGILSRTRPTTLAGFHALIRFHAEDVAFLEHETFGALALRDIADALDALTAG